MEGRVQLRLGGGSFLKIIHSFVGISLSLTCPDFNGCPLPSIPVALGRL